MAIKRAIGGVRVPAPPPISPPGGHTITSASGGVTSWPVARETKPSGWKEEADSLLAARAASSKKPFIAPTPDAIDSATHYLASIVCFESGHHDPPPPWPYRMPCDECYQWAYDHMVQLASHRIPKQEDVHGKDKEAASLGAQPRKQRGRNVARKPARRRGK